MSDNSFYNDFDRERLHVQTGIGRQVEHRTVFQRDRDRILFTTAFRRLQNKTQVFQAGEYDFYRTRLTHSLEVGSIAKSIAAYLRATSPYLNESHHLDLDLVEAISLAHDIGHPPFGHAGERVLNEVMEPYGGFEGNAQSLRILTELIYAQGTHREGMAPSRALLDGILKYKRLFRDRGGDSNHFIYDDQVPFLDFCFGVSDLGSELGKDTAPNDFKSIECQIMDQADDIAYSVFDLVDSIKARFITSETIHDVLEEGKCGRLELEKGDRDILEHLLKRLKEGYYEASLSNRVRDLIQGCRLAEVGNFMSEKTSRYRYELAIDEGASRLIKLFKSLALQFVFQTPALHQIEYKGGHMLRALSRTFFENYLDQDQAKLQLLPQAIHHQLLAIDDKVLRARLICDHLSGMTDAYVIRCYKRLFDPDYGSISELL